MDPIEKERRKAEFLAKQPGYARDRALKYLAQNMPKDKLLEVKVMFDEWRPDAHYYVGDIVQYIGVLYRVVKDHISQEGWEPLNTPEMFDKNASSQFEPKFASSDRNEFLEGLMEGLGYDSEG